MTFTFSGNMLRFVDFQDEIAVDAATVSEGISRLIKIYPDLRPVLFDGDGGMRGVHRLFLDGELLQRAELDRPVGADSEVAVLTPIAGG